MNTLTKAPEYVLWSYTTILLCGGGWVSHWLMSWAKAWKTRKLTFSSFIAENPPAFWLSIVAAAALYVIGPYALPFIGIDLSTIPGATAAVIANLGAYVIGFGADWIVYGVATLVRRATGQNEES